jgi:non-specific serine/threonine protein kinase
MHELTVTPSGQIRIRESQNEHVDSDRLKVLVDAYRESSSEGMLQSATDSMGGELPASFEFARSVARLYLTNLSKSVSVEMGHEIGDLPPPVAEFERLILQAPPMIGLEYVTPEVLSNWWNQLDTLTRKEMELHSGGAEEFLKERVPHWRSVGRVTFHLAENKRNAQYPFAFLATYASGLTAQGKVKHEPLGRALQQYAGDQNRKEMLALLVPVFKAAESSDFIRKLVDSEEIYHPIAWTPREAYGFLKSVSLFESSGLIVRVPDWWNAQKPTRPQVSVKVDTKNSVGIGLDEMLNFSVAMSMDGETLSKDEMQELLESTGGLVPLKGKWVEVDKDKLKQALEHWKGVAQEVREEGMTFFEGMRMLSGAHLAKHEVGAASADIREWSGLTAGADLDEILKGLHSPETRQEKAPAELKAELRKYQQTGYGWLRFIVRLGLGGCLADDMGLGKTVQVIALLLDMKRENSKKKQNASLLVVPASLIGNWKAELAKFAPTLTFAVIHGSEAKAKGGGDWKKEDADDVDLILTTYGMIARYDWMKEYHWRLMILDEAQAIKNSGTKQTRTVKELKSGSRIAMTGTPVENRLSDLWSLFDFLNPGLLGTSKEFSSFVKRLQGGNPPSFEPLRNLVKPYILRRLKTDKKVISDLPDKTEVKAYCTLSKYQAALYQQAVDELQRQLNEVDGMQRRGIVLAQLMRLKQICNHPAQVTGTNDYAPDRSGKFSRLAEIAEEIASRQEKVLIFSQFPEIAEPLAEFLSGIFGQSGLILHGGTSVKKRKEFVDEFQSEDGPPFFVLSLKAGGTGLNLTEASHVIHFDRWWNPAIENQATDRAFRIGQKKNVLVHKFICQGTVEEKIDEMITQKSQIAGEAIGGAEDSGEALLTEMDNDTLMRFVKLDLRQATSG